MTQAMPEKKRKVYEISLVDEATGEIKPIWKIKPFGRTNNRNVAPHIRKFAECELIDLGVKNPRVVITERDAEDDAEKTTEDVCGH